MINGTFTHVNERAVSKFLGQELMSQLAAVTEQMNDLLKRKKVEGGAASAAEDAEMRGGITSSTTGSTSSSTSTASFSSSKEDVGIRRPLQEHPVCP